MSNDYDDGDRSWLSQFEKNRFFQGKLMTPRDMTVEQEYHEDRLQTLTRFVVGSGVVHGLDIQSVTETDAGLEVTVDSGYAIDGHGRPIIVEQLTTKTLPAPSNDEIRLYLRHSEVAMETVPVPDTDGANTNDAVANRAVEVFELTYKETPAAATEAIPSVEIPDIDAHSTEEVARRLAAQYHDDHRCDLDVTTDPAVFLGAFERTPDGTWAEADAPGPQSFVYDHELLFATMLEHLTDTDNPHETPVEDTSDDVPEDIEGVTERLAFLESELDDLKDDRDSLRQYVVRKSSKDRVRFFEALGDRLESHTGEGSLLAREIAETVTTDGVVGDAEAYRRELEELLDLLVDLGEALEGVTTERSLERYLRAVSDLQAAIDAESTLLELTTAHDSVCEAADSLAVLVNVVPDE